MLFFKSNDSGEVIEVTDKVQRGTQWTSRWDIRTMAEADLTASGATKLTNRLHIAIDSGPSVSPRYDVIEAPKVGDKVSYAFNGDYYPDGEIVRIGESMRVITTSTGNKYWRRKKTGSWILRGTWTLVQGHRDDKNPCF
ncbi:hypothetical protein PLUTO_00320 [Luteibacter phage vB_LflM-Pluto]|uniref:Uncharacterized protein n=1 Tax=Luteibacter phage vB_LflM-Pluto TaxID=2948611 RepID=A0A9E7MTQ6_9CAUD|nr:hypothetical protein PLUTO_00320 [Luteibacter phage vB_LflM-Pluto]